MSAHATFCAFHLGDNLFQLHFLRKLAKRHPDQSFVHCAHGGYLPQLVELTEDLPNLVLAPLDAKPDGAVDSWKNAGGFFERHKDRNDYYGFYLDWFAELASRMGFDPVFEDRTELLFDYPALLNATPLSAPFDILFINSQPCSGQWPAMAYAPDDDGHYLDAVTRDLAWLHKVIVTQPCPWIGGVTCTQDSGLTLTGIGNLSIHCHTILMIGTGPAWPTMNVFCRDNINRRIALFEPEHITGMSSRPIPHVHDRDDLWAVLQMEGLL